MRLITALQMSLSKSTSASFSEGPIGSKFAWAVRPTVSHNELVTGAAPSSEAGFTNGVCTDADNSWLAYDQTPRVQSMTGDHAIVCVASFTAASAYAKLVSIAYRNDTSWSSPWIAMELRRDNQTNQVNGSFTISGGSNYNSQSQSGLLLDGTTRQYVYQRSGQWANVFIDGVQVTTGASVSTADVDVSAGAPIVISNRTPLNPGEGMAGTFYFCGITDSSLTLSEMVEISNNPLTFQ